MEEVRDKPKDSNAARENNQLVFLAQLLKENLLVFLEQLAACFAAYMELSICIPEVVTASRAAGHRLKPSEAIIFVQQAQIQIRQACLQVDAVHVVSRNLYPGFPKRTRQKSGCTPAKR